MRPLNGKCRMTPEERKARHKELMKDPVVHANYLRAARKRREKYKDTINARKRQRYADDKDYRDAARARRMAYRAAHAEEYRAYMREWNSRHKDERREYWEKYKLTDAGKAKKQRSMDRRRERLATDPEYREHERQMKREWYERFKRTAAGAAWYRRNLLVPRWEKAVAEGPDGIAKYLKRVRCENVKRAFIKWYTQRQGLINRTRGLGRIEQERD